jgi:hypothetical protein
VRRCLLLLLTLLAYLHSKVFIKFRVDVKVVELGEKPARRTPGLRCVLRLLLLRRHLPISLASSRLLHHATRSCEDSDCDRQATGKLFDCDRFRLRLPSMSAAKCNNSRESEQTERLKSLRECIGWTAAIWLPGVVIGSSYSFSRRDS